VRARAENEPLITLEEWHPRRLKSSSTTMTPRTHTSHLPLLPVQMAPRLRTRKPKRVLMSVFTRPVSGKSDSLQSLTGEHKLTKRRDFLLKPELLRAISDLGFEHPSEGTCFNCRFTLTGQSSKNAFPSPFSVKTFCVKQSLVWVRLPSLSSLRFSKCTFRSSPIPCLALTYTLTSEPVDGETSIIILCHTRELAYQIRNEFIRFSKYMADVRTSVFYGGTPITADREILANKEKCPHIVVGTPGRTLALIRDGKLKANTVKHFVLDECDKMLEQLGTFLHRLSF
jgi:ATP-dependent RNA helicase UAP56/SUB2